ncbi:hypothetical protein [Pseudomonas sp. NPDC086251]|uniref:ATP-dependent DNA ligase n=1 Tax=Pseudomonas sp. NPDC086251 TaxID=3364431 RepID=UPI003835F0C5
MSSLFFAFDLMYLNGLDMRSLPVELRRERLSELIDDSSLEHVRFSETLDVDPHHFMANVCKMEMEGIIGKRAGSPYAVGADMILTQAAGNH